MIPPFETNEKISYPMYIRQVHIQLLFIDRRYRVHLNLQIPAHFELTSVHNMSHRLAKVALTQGLYGLEGLELG